MRGSKGIPPNGCSGMSRFRRMPSWHLPPSRAWNARNNNSHPSPCLHTVFPVLLLSWSVPLPEEYRIQAVDVDAQHLALRRKLAVNPGHVVIAVPHEHAQEFQVAAPDEVARRKRVPEQVRMQPLDSGFPLEFCENLLQRICGQRFSGTQGRKEVSGGVSVEFRVTVNLPYQEVGHRRDPALASLAVQDMYDVPVPVNVPRLQVPDFL